MTRRTQIPPLPFGKLDTNDTTWQLWFNRVRTAIDQPLSWSDIDFAGSDITNIQTRKHNDLQNILGAGTTHLSSGAALFIEGSGYGAYTPTLTNFTNVTGTAGNYTQVGNLVVCTVVLTGSSGINVGANATVSLPVNAIVDAVTTSSNYTIVGTTDHTTQKMIFTTGGAVGNKLVIQSVYIYK